MNKLVSKNSVLKFKEGRKIVKALGGLPMVISNQGGVPAVRPVTQTMVAPTATNGGVRVLGVTTNTTQGAVNAVTDTGKGLLGKVRSVVGNAGRGLLRRAGNVGRGLLRGAGPLGLSIAIGSEVGDRLGRATWNKAYEHAYNLGIQLREQNKLRLRAYLDAASTAGAFGGPNLSNMDNILEVRLSRPAVAAKPKQRSGWSYGYNRSNEISDIKATQQMLKDAGFLSSDKYNVVDGKWGKNTEAAYLKYLLLLNIPTYEKPEIPSVAEMAGIYSEENKPLYLQIRFKQGGQLVSRNPIKRFKNKKK